MTQARRWYDKDPVLKEALELLRLQTDETKADYIKNKPNIVTLEYLEEYVANAIASIPSAEEDKEGF